MKILAILLTILLTLTSCSNNEKITLPSNSKPGSESSQVNNVVEEKKEDI